MSFQAGTHCQLVGRAKPLHGSLLLTAQAEGGRRRTTVNLAPADVKDEGPSFDLPIVLRARVEGKVGALAPPENAAGAGVVSGDRIAVEPCRSYGA